MIDFSRSRLGAINVPDWHSLKSTSICVVVDVAEVLPVLAASTVVVEAR